MVVVGEDTLSKVMSLTPSTGYQKDIFQISCGQNWTDVWKVKKYGMTHFLKNRIKQINN